MKNFQVRTCVLLVTLAACTPGDQPKRGVQAAADSQAANIRAVVAAGGVVDSILPIAEHLRRFRATAGERPDTLRHASPTAKLLLDRWARALSARDTTALNQMLLDRAEFAWLYYPDAKMSKPPYEAPPGLLWGQLLASSNTGVHKLLNKFGGASLSIRSFTCPRAAEIEGDNRLHEGCIVRLKAGQSSVAPNRFFGTIIERNERFKFIGYANRL